MAGHVREAAAHGPVACLEADTRVALQHVHDTVVGGVLSGGTRLWWDDDAHPKMARDCRSGKLQNLRSKLQRVPALDF